MNARIRSIYFPALCAAANMFHASAIRADESAQGRPAASAMTSSRLFRTDTMYIMSLLKKQPVQSELGLAENQIKAISELDHARFTEMKSLFNAMRGVTGPQKSEAQKKFQKASAEHDSAARKFIDNELSDEQQRRLKQIYWQQIGPGAFSDNEVSAVLSLTRDQVTKLAAAQAELRKLRSEDLKKQAQTGNPPKGVGVRVVLPSAAFTRQAMEKLTGVLTEEQLARFTQLLGAPLAIGDAPGDRDIGAGAAAPVSDDKDDRQPGGPE